MLSCGSLPGPHWGSKIAAPLTWLTGVFSIPVCTSHTGISGWPSISAANHFLPWWCRCVLKYMKWEQDLPLYMYYAFTSYFWLWRTHNTHNEEHGLVELALHSLAILWIVKEWSKNCLHMLAMTYAQVDQCIQTPGLETFKLIPLMVTE